MLAKKGGILKKLMMSAAILALVLAAAVPAIAQVNNGIGQEDETGNTTLSFSDQASGNNANQCLTPQQFGNTGSAQNAQGVIQYNSVAGDIEPEGSTFTLAPELTAPCNQAVQQSAAASGGPSAPPADPPSSKGGGKNK
jgi:hypothetical protein